MEKFFLGNKMVMILMVLSTLDACDVRAGYTHYTCCLFIVTGYNLNEYWPELLWCGISRCSLCNVSNGYLMNLV